MFHSQATEVRFDNLSAFRSLGQFDLSSSFRYFRQTSDRERRVFRGLEELELAESLSSRILESLTSNFFYRFNEHDDEFLLVRERAHSGEVSLEQRLYESLISRLILRTESRRGEDTHSRLYGGTASLDYRKRTGDWGVFQLAYLTFYDRTYNERGSTTASVSDEPVLLIGFASIRLAKKDIDPGSVALTNEDRTITYLQGPDYRLVPDSPYLKIGRTLGSDIGNMQTVPVSYRHRVDPSSIQITRTERVRVACDLARTLRVYRMRNTQRRDISSEIERPLLEDTSVDTTYGAELRWRGFHARAERETYQSDIQPFTAHRCEARYNALLKNRYALGIGGRWREPEQPPVWPEPPDPPRMRYVRSIVDTTAFLPRPTFLQRLAHAVKGPEEPDRLARPYGLTVDSQRRLLVADTGGRQGRCFDLARNRTYLFEPPAVGALESAVGVALDGGDGLYVSDSAAVRIHFYHRDGTYVRTLRTPSELRHPTGLAFGQDGSILFVADTVGHCVWALAPDGAEKFRLGEPGEAYGQLNAPTDLWLSEIKELYVTDSLNFRTQAFSTSGQWRRSVGLLGDYVGGEGSAGHHGFFHPYLLERHYDTADFIVQSPATYALCYRCHDGSSIPEDRSFSEQRRHIVEENAPCAACHDAQRVDPARGNAVNNAHLINFDTRVVFPSSTGRLHRERTGPFAGRCFLRCHGKNRDPRSYPEN